jgi:membrane protease YdiL (CAAX protease family)
VNAFVAHLDMPRASACAGALYLASLAWYLDGSRGSVVAAAAVLGFAAVEEAVFRHWLARRLIQDHGLIVASTASAVIFSLVHFKLSPFIMLGGLMLTLLYFATRSVVPGILLHAAHNHFGAGIKEDLPSNFAQRFLGPAFPHSAILTFLLCGYLVLTVWLATALWKDRLALGASFRNLKDFESHHAA